MGLSVCSNHSRHQWWFDWCVGLTEREREKAWPVGCVLGDPKEGSLHVLEGGNWNPLALVGWSLFYLRLLDWGVWWGDFLQIDELIWCWWWWWIHLCRYWAWLGCVGRGPFLGCSRGSWWYIPLGCSAMPPYLITWLCFSRVVQGPDTTNFHETNNFLPVENRHNKLQ